MMLHACFCKTGHLSASMVHILATVIREACCKAVGLLAVEIVDALFFLGFPAKEFFLLYNLKKDYFFVWAGF
jgi:hypothetical protein